MNVKIGHSSIDEHGKAAGGDVGDQTGKEICTRDWWDKGWNVYLECTDKVLANAAATYMEQICADHNFGYDQSQRTTGYFSIHQNGDKVKGAKGEFDCSTAVSSCYHLAGLDDLNVSNTTKSLRQALLNTGKFVEYTDSQHLRNAGMAKRGGIYLKEGHHVVMVLTSPNDIPKNPYVKPTTTIEFGESGIGVRWVQWELRRLGYNIKVDGEFGPKTDKAAKTFQKSVGIKVDGKVGPDTRKHLIEAK